MGLVASEVPSASQRDSTAAATLPGAPTGTRAITSRPFGPTATSSPCPQVLVRRHPTSWPWTVTRSRSASLAARASASSSQTTSLPLAPGRAPERAVPGWPPAGRGATSGNADAFGGRHVLGIAERLDEIVHLSCRAGVTQPGGGVSKPIRVDAVEASRGRELADQLPCGRGERAAHAPFSCVGDETFETAHEPGAVGRCQRVVDGPTQGPLPASASPGPGAPASPVDGHISEQVLVARREESLGRPAPETSGQVVVGLSPPPPRHLLLSDAFGVFDERGVAGVAGGKPFPGEVGQCLAPGVCRGGAGERVELHGRGLRSGAGQTLR